MTKKIDRRRFKTPVGTMKYTFVSMKSKDHDRYETGLVLSRNEAEGLISAMAEELDKFIDSSSVDFDQYDAKPLYRNLDDSSLLFNFQRRYSAPFTLTPDGESVRDSVRDGSQVAITGEIVPYVSNSWNEYGVSLRMDQIIVHELQSKDTRTEEEKASAKDRNDSYRYGPAVGDGLPAALSSLVSGPPVDEELEAQRLAYLSSFSYDLDDGE